MPNGASGIASRSSAEVKPGIREGEQLFQSKCSSRSSARTQCIAHSEGHNVGTWYAFPRALASASATCTWRMLLTLTPIEPPLGRTLHEQDGASNCWTLEFMRREQPKAQAQAGFWTRDWLRHITRATYIQLQRSGCGSARTGLLQSAGGHHYDAPMARLNVDGTGFSAACRGSSASCAILSASPQSSGQWHQGCAAMLNVVTCGNAHKLGSETRRAC